MDNPAILTRLRLLEDKEDLRSLINRYQLAADELDYGGQAAVFTPDGEFETPIGVLRGREEIESALAGATEEAKVKFHTMSNLEFRVAGDRATGRANMNFVCIFDPQRPYLLSGEGCPVGGASGGGYYEWQFARVADGWWIKHQKLALTWYGSASLPYAERT
jgi:hypothetical protein